MSCSQRVLRAAACVAAAALAVPAAAFVRSADADTGRALFWPMPVVPFRVSSAAAARAPSCAVVGGVDPMLEAARRGFAQWRQGCSDFDYVFAGQIDDVRTGVRGAREDLVVFRQGFCSANPDAVACLAAGGKDCGNTFNCFVDRTVGDRGIVALTSVLYDPATGRIVNADIEVNGWNGKGALLSGGSSGPVNGWYFTCGDPAGLPACTTYGQGGCGYIDLQNTLTHEAGHFLGLAHPCGDANEAPCPDACAPGDTACATMVASTMFPTTSPEDTQKRTLNSDDVAGLCAIYPAGSGCACGSAGAPGAIALLLAALALRPRRRRSTS